MDRLTSEHETLLRQGSYCSDCLSDSEWSESSISSSCSSSSSDHSSNRSNSYREWKDEILPNGEVFHVRSEKLNTDFNAKNSTFQNEPAQKNGREKSTTEKLVRLIRRRNSRRIRKKHLSDFVHDSDKVSAASKENSNDSKGANPLCDKGLDSNKLDEFYSSLPFGVMYFRVNEISETDRGDQGLVYCYPRPFSKNLLYSIKGALIMLYQLLSDITVSPLISSSIVLNNHLCHIIFTPQNFELMIFTVLDVRCSRAEAVALNADIVRFLQFNYQTLSRCFSSLGNHAALDNLFASVFARLFNKGSKSQMTAEDKMSLLNTSASCCFEQYALVAHWLPLPRDAQVQIDDALSELESNDFAEISNAHYGCQRLYTIVGSCLFYKSYLLATHMNQQDLIDVASFCRHHNLLQLAHNELIKSMVIWREVFLSSCDRGLSRSSSSSSSYKLPQGRWFLLVVGLGHTMLAVALEAGGCTAKVPEEPSPDSFYVKQALETLKHVIKIGVISLVEHWMPLYPHSQVLSADSVDALKSSPKSVENLSHTSHSSSPQGTKKGQENASMSRMNPERSSLSLSCGGEDTSSSITSEVGSVSHGPVMGRRAQREKAQSSFSDSNSHHLDSECELSDSDVTHSQFDLANTDTNFKSRSSINSIESSIPSKISGGDMNLLFHFIQLDRMEGILLSPPDLGNSQSNKLKFIIDNFRSSVYAIQRIFENTIRFKKLNGLEVERSVMNNSLIAIKEHGVLFECPIGNTDSERKTVLSYWVIGRLFFVPQPREIYVCYQDSVSQNLVEIAFRIGFVSAG